MKLEEKELLKYVGNMSQISDIREMVFESGKSRGMRVYQVQAGNGLIFDLLPDKCLDIARLCYKGININWQAKNGFCSPAGAHPVKNEFDRYFSGGMMLTCGLKNTGPDYTDAAGYFQPLHGRLGITPCEQSYYRCYFDESGDYTLEAGGVVRDSVLGGHNLTLTRTIKTSFAKPVISIEDVLENQEPTDTDYVILYHFNFGYPFVSPDLKMVFPDAVTPIKPRTPAAEKNLNRWQKMESPEDNFEENCYFHDLQPEKDGYSRVKLVNEKLGISASLAYGKRSLPVLTEWKSIRSGEYVLGIEPGNSYISGMDNERKNGRVGKIAAFGREVFHLELSFE